MCDATATVKPEERLRLRNFVRLVGEMLQSRFWVRVLSMDHTITFENAPDGQSCTLTAPEYDKDDFRSFLTSFRQIALNKSDPVYITSIRNIISRYAHEQHKEGLRNLKKHIGNALEGRFTTMKMGLPTESGPVELCGVELLDAIVNGEVFHSGPDHEEVLQQLQTVPRGSYLGTVLFDVIEPILDASRYLVRLIRSNNLVPEADLPAWVQTFTEEGRL